MTDPDLIGLFVEPLERIGLAYIVTGGVASVIYGDPRFTRDIDIVLELQRDSIPALISEFAGDAFYVPPVEVLEKEVARAAGGHFNLIHHDTALRADIYLIGDDALHVWAFDRRRRVELDPTSIWVAPIEYVILRKLEYFVSSESDRHLRDVSMMLSISRELIDDQALLKWADDLALMNALEKARKYRP